MEAREVSCVQHGAATDPVEVGNLDRRIVIVDRIIRVARTAVRRVVELAELTRLPITPAGRVFGRLHPVALLQTKDVHLGFGEAPRHGGTGGPGTDDQDVYGFVGHGTVLAVTDLRAVDFVQMSLST